VTPAGNTNYPPETSNVDYIGLTYMVGPLIYGFPSFVNIPNEFACHLSLFSTFYQSLLDISKFSTLLLV